MKITKMNKLKYYLLTVFIMVLAAGPAFAQQDLNIPLSNPGEPGTLIINAVFSDQIVVRTHDRDDVIVKYDAEGMDEEGPKTKNGLRKISSAGGGIEVTEENNEVKIQTSPMPSDLDLSIYVPRNFSLKLNSTQGDVEVHGIEGELEVSAVNGDIELLDVAGSVVVNSVNGDIEVELNRIFEGVPMSFTGVNGDMEITLPADASFSAKMKTEWGDIYTNFDMEIERSPVKTEARDDDGRYKVAVNKWVYGNVNGGGPEFLFKTLHGDISIRKK